MAFCVFETIASHAATSVRSSLSSSATRLPSATVRTIMPKFFGLMLWSSCLRRVRSSGDFIFDDTDTLSSNGISMRNRPANDSSPVSRGPFVFMGSFVICTSISCPVSSASEMFPSFDLSGCMLAFEMGKCLFLSLVICFRYF